MDRSALARVGVLPLLAIAPASAAADTASFPRRETVPHAGTLGPERWLQDRLFEAPGLLLAGAASPRHGRLRSVCCELPLGEAGYADLFGVTPEGELAIAEVKLGANAEARRKIVAQALDYYAAIRRLSYDALQAACAGAARTRIGPGADLYAVSGAAEIDLPEDEFIARVEANLRRGSLLLALVLDRAPERLARLIADTIAEQPALPFDVELIEIALYDLPDGNIALAPTLRGAARATTRAVVRLEGAVATVATAEDAAATTSRPAPRSEAEFYAALDTRHPGAFARLRAFLEAAAPFGVTGQVARSLILRLDGINIGSLHLSGAFQVYPTDPSRDAGRALFSEYTNAVHRLAGGTLADRTAAGEAWLRCDVTRLLDRADEWIAAIRAYREAINPDAIAPESAP